MSTVPPGHKIVTRTSAITANYRRTDPQQAIGDPEGIFIKKDTGRTIFGVGTKTPYSRISMGEIGSSLADQTPALAFTEDASGNYSTGISFSRESSQKINLRFIINKLDSVAQTELNKTQLEYNPQSVTDAPILSLTKTIETIDFETLENGQEANTGNKVFINCIEPIRGGFSQRSGLEVNGMISLTDRLNFFRTSVIEEVPTGSSQVASLALFHEQADGSKKQLLTRTGQNRVIDASHTLISVLPDAFTNGILGSTVPGYDPSGLFVFKNCDFVIGNGEMGATAQLQPTIADTEYWERFKHISTSFLNLRGNTIFSHVNDISSALLPIVSKAFEHVDYSRNGVLYLQNNLGIGSYQPKAIIDCSKVNLPFLMMGRDINDISNNTVAFGDDLNIPLANYSFIFGEEHDLSGGPGTFNSNYNFIFGKENSASSGPSRLNNNFIYGKGHFFQGDYNFLFGNNHRLSVDVSYCTLLGHNGKIESADVSSAIMKYTLGENNDIFVLTRRGDINILRDICCNDICSNEIIVKYIAKPNQYAENAYIKDISAENISLEKIEDGKK